MGEKITEKSQIELDFFAAVPQPVTAPISEEKLVDWRTKVPSVSQVTRRIRGHIENSFFDVWVKGEISNFKRAPSGHAYFILKDATAQLRSVMFRSQLSKIKFEIKDGMEILLHGKITVYEARGEYQMDCDTMEPVGVGALQLAFEQLKQKLFKEGLFDPQHKKKLPFLPKRIGIITSATGAAVKDILKVLVRRYPNRDILVIPTSVQGEKATSEIVAALQTAQRWNEINIDRALDVIILGRGGGSIEDLWCFNEEAVARAVHRCTIPIISAVGHEIDTTICDFVADVRAPTPSAAAEMVIPTKDELIQLVEHQTIRLGHLMERRLQQLRLHLGHLSQRLMDPRQKIKKLHKDFVDLQARLWSTLKTQILFSRRRAENAIQLLNSLSPLQVIGRGYSLTQSNNGAIVRSLKEVKPGDVLQTRVADGTILSRVEKPTA